jgi:hypothetical protein
MEDHDWCEHSELIDTGETFQHDGMSISLIGSRLLQQRVLRLNEDSLFFILNHIDWFVSKSRDNESVQVLVLYPYTFNSNDDDVWDKVGQVVGNFEALDQLCITNENSYGDHEDPPVPPAYPFSGGNSLVS